MSESSEQYLFQAIDSLSQSDPLIKLLQEVKLGRMKPSDGGLRAITESWLYTYRKVLEKGIDATPATLRKLNPSPRLDVLIETGMVPADHPEVVALRKTYHEMLNR